jgi:8-oxo-dGTP pyrophosphatase MutT (NUDIX family)
VEAGETLQEAAARELYEEVAIRRGTETFSGPYETSTIEFVWADYAITQDQTFFAIRMSDTPISFDHMEQIEKDTTIGFRWWSAEELESTEEVFFPEHLASILRKITKGGEFA